MQSLPRELSAIANEILETWDITQFEALQIAVKMQNSRVLSDIFLLGRTCPTALEAIVIEMREANSISGQL